MGTNSIKLDLTRIGELNRRHLVQKVEDDIQRKQLVQQLQQKIKQKYQHRYERIPHKYLTVNCI